MRHSDEPCTIDALAAQSYGNEVGRLRAENKRLRTALLGVKNGGGCWCIDRPMDGEHDDRCVAANFVLGGV